VRHDGGMADSERISLAAPGSVRLSVLRAGPRDGEPVVLLHGFPEGAALGWRRQIPALAAAGFRVWAPDQRGYGDSDRPSRVRDYHIDALAADACAVLDAAAAETGRARAHLVGHDWGGGVAWWTALVAPQRLASLTILNCPHPLVMRRALLGGNPRQMLRSWYFAWFLVPWLPETLAGAFGAASLARGLRKSARPGVFGDADLLAYRALWSRPGALRAMIHWYRAVRLAPAVPRAAPDGRVRVPTRLIFGARDVFLRRELVPASAALCERCELTFIEEATHWVQHEEPERVNAWIAAWVTEHAAGPRAG
jgi:pimeloyl-ACP methyl ester carboxylesterase